MMVDLATTPPVALSSRLGHLRRLRGWTLADLSDRAQLSRPYLSRLESGRRQPSLAALLALARAYQMPLQSLVDTGAPEQPPPVQSSSEQSSLVQSSRVIVSNGRTQIRRGNGLRYRTVSGGGPWVNLNAVHVTVPHSRRRAPLAHHDGEELLYVLTGSLNLIFEHQTHLLHPGDSAHFDARLPHRLEAVASGDTEVLLVAYVPPPDRIDAAARASVDAKVRTPAKRRKAALNGSATVTICTALDQAP
jgi:transcriptional regulator with XRE-family HTH domain